MAIPDSLDHRLRLFKQSGRVFQGEGDVFGENSWTQVMLGQGLMPQQYHPIVNMMSDSELQGFLQSNKAIVDHVINQLPSHHQFLLSTVPLNWFPYRRRYRESNKCFRRTHRRVLQPPNYWVLSRWILSHQQI